MPDERRVPHEDADRDGDHAHEDRGEPGRHAQGRQHEQQGDQRNQGNEHAEPQVSGGVEDLLKHGDIPFAWDAAFSKRASQAHPVSSRVCPAGIQ